MDEDRDRIEQNFRWAVQALAQPAEVQPRLFPSFVVVGDELGSDFDNWRRTCEAHFGESWSSKQRKAVLSLDQALDRVFSPKPNRKREQNGLKDRDWDEVRDRARECLEAFGWPSEMPPTGRALYAQCPPDTRR